MRAMNLVKVGLLTLAFALGVGACTPRLKTQFLTDAATSRLRSADAEAFAPDAPAVVLLRQRKVFMFYDAGESFTQFQRREVIAIQSEAGRARGEITIPVSGQMRVTEVRARRIDPDGSVFEVDEGAIFASKAESKDGSARRDIRSFRIPDVKVGSVIEYVYTAEVPWAVPHMVDYAVHDLPVLKYEAEVLVHERVRVSLRVYGTDQPIQRERAGEYERLRFQLARIPARVTEPWAPAQSYTTPWWMMRVRQYTYGTWASDPISSWGAAVANWAQRARFEGEDKALLAGFSEPVSLEGCADRTCAVERVWARVRERTDVNEAGTLLESRPLRELISGANVSASERALLVHRMLGEAGVESRIGVGTRFLSHREDRTFFATPQFNHALVYVPQQPGVANALWIDPQCEACAPGELPSWSEGIEALLLPTTKDAEAVFKPVEGRSAPPGTQVRRMDATLSAEGDVRVTWLEEEQGESSPGPTGSTRRALAREPQVRAAAKVRALSAAAQLEDGRYVCGEGEDAPCRWELAFRQPGYAAAEALDGGGELHVPLTLLSNAFEMLARQPQRKTPMHVGTHRRLVDVLHVRLPNGFELASLPPPVDASHGAFRVTARFERTREGVEIHRTLDIVRGFYPKESWPKQLEVIRTYADVSATVLRVKPRALTVPTPAAGSADLMQVP